MKNAEAEWLVRYKPRSTVCREACDEILQSIARRSQIHHARLQRQVLDDEAWDAADRRENCIFSYAHDRSYNRMS